MGRCPTSSSSSKPPGCSTTGSPLVRSTYRSPNAPDERDVLGTLLLSLLAGHRRYAHISSIRGDGVNPELLGMSKVVSEDSVRRGVSKGRRRSLRRLVARAFAAQLRAAAGRALDPRRRLHGQTAVRASAGGRAGLQPAQAGAAPRTSTTPILWPTCAWCWRWKCSRATRRASSYAQPALWEFVDGLKPEQRELPYLFKLRQSRGVKALLQRLFRRRGVGAGRRRLARSTRGLAAGRLESKAAGGGVAAAGPQRSGPHAA